MRFLFATLSVLLACAPGATPTIELYDPLGLTDVTSELRLLVFPSDVRSCNADGTLSPSLGEDMGAVFPDATADIRLGVGAQGMVNLDEGTYVVSVLGWGNDPITMRMGVLVARGCSADVVIESGQTRTIDLTVQNVEGTGMCNDGLLSPDEQCEPTRGPLPCSTSCRTESQVAHTTVAGTQNNAALGWAAGSRMVLAFDETMESQVRFMLRDENGQTITAPAALAVDDIIADPPGVQTSVAAASSASRVAAAYGDVGAPVMTGGGDVYVRFFDPANRTAMGADAKGALASTMAGVQLNPSMAMLADGTLLVAFEDSMAAAGVSGRVFSATSLTPTGDVTFGGIGGTSPSVAAAGSTFVVAYASGAGVQAQRFDSSGAAMGAPIGVGDTGGTQTAPSVGGLPDGRFLVSWVRDGRVRARAFDAAGTPMPIVDVDASGSHPAVAAGGGRYLVAWEAAGNVRARYLDGAGAFAQNREQPRTREPFTVAAGTAPVAAVGAGSPTVIAGVAYESGGDISLRLFPLP